MNKFSSKEIITIVRNNFIIIITIALVGGVGFLGYAKHKRTTEYTAQCNLMIGHNLNQVSQKSRQNEADLARMKTYEDVIEDPSVARRAHQYLDSRDKKKLSTKKINHGIKATSSTDSLVMNINATAPTAKLATTMANTTAKAVKKELPETVPDVGRVSIISYAKRSDVVSHTHPSYKKYGIVGVAFGALVGMIIAFVWTSWRHLLPEE